ncbi:MAG: YdbL family protein [Novosphingobium sp.]|nr:YdbL family protein [Novosphingobium sp.]
MKKLTQTNLLRRLGGAAGAVALVLGAISATAVAAARDPQYAAALAAKEVGQQVDGYLGIVGASNADLRRMVDDINIKRKAVYAQKAAEQHATVEDYAFTSGCLLIAQTKSGEMYQAPDLSWKTRTGAPPLRDSRCP